MKRSIFYSCYFPRYRKDEKEGKPILPIAEQTIKYAKEDGLEGIELLPVGDLCTNNAVEYAKKLRGIIDDEGIECSCYSYGISMLGDPKTSLELLKRSVDIAKELGSPYLHHTMQCTFNQSDLPKELTVYQNAEKIFVDVSKEVAYYAGEKGIECIYEDQGLYLNTVERLGELIHKINLPNTGVCLDIGNSLDYDISPLCFAGAFAGVTKHVHIKDLVKNDAPTCPGKGWSASVSGTWLKNCVPGTGIVDMEKIFNILLLAGYEGYFSLENQNSLHNLSDESADADIAVAFENMQKAYNRAKASMR